MTTVLEQMARAICWTYLLPILERPALEAEVAKSWEYWLPEAKAALQPLLGELPEGVIGAGHAENPRINGVEPAFHAMIQAILTEGE